MRYETIWERRTAHFRVGLAWAYEDDPDLSWADQETLDNLASGEWTNCTFRVLVTDEHGCELGAQSLGNSIYADPREFIDHRACGRANRELAARGEAGRCGSYFRDMLAEACQEARAAYSTPRAYLRKPA